jgi:hypothetical protein
VLAGYLSSTEKWSAFSDEWKAVLDIQHPAPLPYLKMADAYQLRKQKSVFRGWTEEQRDARLQKFCPVINRHVEHGFAVVIPIDAHRKHFRGLFNPDALDRPYFLALFALAASVANVTRRLGYKEKVELIFDQQPNESKPLLMAEFDKFVGLAPPEKAGVFNIPKWENDVDVRPLQAADMLAWHVRRGYHEQMHGRDPTLHPTNAYLANIMDLNHDVLDVWTEERLQDTANAMHAARAARIT